ncbi:11250_t:CDS:2, partial [Racocetra fulgida]
AVLVVTPMDVIKIRLQAQRHSMADPLDIPKYRNAAHAAYTIVREEGVRALYKGVLLTALRQATNQAVNFTVYQEMKQHMKKFQGTKDGQELPTYQHLLMGGISGAMDANPEIG